MEFQVRQNRLHHEKTQLNQLDISNEGAEVYLKAQSYTVVNLMRDLDPQYGIKAEQTIDALWAKYYDKRKKWQMDNSDPIKKKQNYARFADKALQSLHFDICRAIQNIVDEGELLE